MQSVSSRIWTRVAVSISYDDIDMMMLEKIFWKNLQGLNFYVQIVNNI